MSHTTIHHDHAGHDDHGGNSKYIVVFVALCVLTTMSFFTYSSYWPWEPPEIKRLFMTAVSCTKAMLVILFFMHVKYEANWKYVLTIPASIMSVFLCLALVPDIGARMNGLFGYEGRYSAERNEHIGRLEDQKGNVIYDANALMREASLDVVHHSAEHHAGAALDSSDHVVPAAAAPAAEGKPAAPAENEKN